MQLRKLISSQQVSLAALVFCTALHGVAAPAKKSHKASKSPPQTQPMSYYLQPHIAAQSLDWVSTPGTCNVCAGYFYQPVDLRKHPNPLPASQLPSNITSHGPAEFEQNGTSKLTDGVVVTQPGRRITADTAFVKRDSKTGKITMITLIGNVHLQQYNRLIVATYARMNLVEHSITLKNALYHIGPASSGEVGKKIKLDYDAWGYAAYIHNPTHEIINLRDTTYSTCTPRNQVWMLSGSHMHFDRNRGYGTAQNVLLRIRKIPVAFVPYLRFPLDNRRLTGFLIPTFSHSKKQGTRIGAPFYWNMAPNYDMTITPYYNFKRGFQIEDLFRYLTNRGHGTLDLSYLPYDNGFKKYREDTISNYQGDPELDLFVSKLRSMHNYRAFASFNGEQYWDDDWHSNFHLNYVTDPYYFRDVNSDASFINPDQLLNEADLQYQGQHWNFTSMVEGYQTLHRIDQFEQPVYDQYMRLPEFDATAYYPDIWRHLSWHASSQAVDFQYEGAFPTEQPNLPIAIGQRFHARPSFDYDEVWSSGYIDPQVYLDMTSYLTRFKDGNNGASRSNFDKSRALPIVDVDTGLYFDRNFNFDGGQYTQTLEPRLFYLYVPYENQDQYPDYDTQLLPFSVNQLYSVNRFTGYDRLDNANQVTLGVSSRILNSDTGEEKIDANLGFIYYMQKQRVDLPGVTLNDNSISPLVGSLDYHINQDWIYGGGAAWDAEQGKMNNAATYLRYDSGNNRILSLGYRYIFDEGDNLLNQTNSTSQLYGGFSLPFYHQRWTSFAYAEYDFSGDYPVSYLAGLQYDSCCWALRFVFDRRFIGRSPSSTSGDIINNYDNVYYVQLQLKGLASVGNNSAAAVLQDRLPGYQDPFANSL